MTDIDIVRAGLERSAKGVASLGRVIKALCGVMLFACGIMLLYALTRIGSRAEEFVAFGLMSIGLTAITLLVWSQASFQSIGARSALLLASMHDDVGELLRLERRAAKRLEHEQKAAGGAPLALGVATIEPSIETRGAELSATSTPALAAPPRPESPAEPVPVREVASAPVTPTPVKQTAPAPATRECPHCGETVRADATRCRNCFSRI